MTARRPLSAAVLRLLADEARATSQAAAAEAERLDLQGMEVAARALAAAGGWGVVADLLDAAAHHAARIERRLA